MKNAKDIVYEIWKSHKNYLGKEPEGNPDFDLSRYFANLFCPGDYYYYVLDSPTLTFDMVSPSVEKILGLKPDEFSFDTLVERIHPDDMHFLMKCEDVVAYFLKNCIPPEKMVKYKITYCIREKTPDKGFRLFLLQTITMQTTVEGALLKVFGSHTDITHITDVNNRKLSLIGLDGEPSFLEIDVFDEKVLNQYEPFDLKSVPVLVYTSRELDVIRNLALGLTTEEIAGKLFLTKYTVETHRKNILKKSKAKNTTEVVVECLKNGFL